jgi:AcrR family transcriptional regulator
MTLISIIKSMPRIPDRDTQRLILEAAWRLFYQRGFDAVSMDEIATQAKVTKRAIYYHFPTKAELIVAMLKSSQDPALKLLQGLAGPASPGRGASVERLFQELERMAWGPQFNGCLFVRASVAFPKDQAVIHEARSHKQAMNQWLLQYAKDLGAANAQALADALHLLIDTVLSTAHLYDKADLFGRIHRTLRATLVQHGLMPPGAQPDAQT